MPLRPDHTHAGNWPAKAVLLQGRSPFVWPLRVFILFYRYAISPMLGPRCRFAPTCSEYALEALDRYGALRGSLFAIRRVMRCHPWGGSGYDPLPDEDPGRGGDPVHASSKGRSPT
ncbi:MAG: membrane protein insertion efficiency factor YidD [Geminicoccaceae bacterium]|nr:membrane protein insertion efficiency factor YidD [Geminicoccaceae bacterium]